MKILAVLPFVALLAAADGLGAQAVPIKPAPDSASAARDSTGKDTTQVELIKWAETDSVMAVLMARAGYEATRYQGNKVTFNAQTKSLSIVGNRAGVQRGEAIVVGDSIIYDDSTKIVVAIGDSVVLRNPNQGAEDVKSRGRIAYNLALRRGTVTNISTAVTSGQKWYVKGAQAAFVDDSSVVTERTFYAKNGIITSCDDSIPDYYFKTGEVKLVSKNIMVARPAVLYIGDVPIMWLPFIFQDMRSGRRSGVLTPRLGLSEVFRNSPTYRRHAENLGYYFAFSDYMDASVWADWRSGSRPSEGDPGWLRLNGEWQYRWLDRFVTGRIAASKMSLRDGTSNTAVSWTHSQSFSEATHFTTNVNFVTNTSVQRQTSFDPRQVLATIGSQLNYQTQLGKIPLSIGGSRKQYTGRQEVDQSFPNLDIARVTFSPTSWLDWMPSLSIQNDERLNVDQVGEFTYRYFTNAAGVEDSSKIKRSDRNTSWSLQSPFKIGSFDWNNMFTMRDQYTDAPVTIPLVDPNDTSSHVSRVFAKTFSTQVDWNTDIALPSMLHGTFNLSPHVSFTNVDPGYGFWVRTEQTDGRFVHQSKRVSGGVSVTPTFFGLFRGFGPVTRLRHSITPTLSWSVSPRASVPYDLLRALNKSPQEYIGSLPQNQLTLSISQVLEAKMRVTDTTKGAEPKKMKLLAVDFSPLVYDFERAKATHHSGFATNRFSYDVTSDLLPGFHATVDYSLYEGDVLSDSAKFKPYRENINASFNLNGQSGLLGAINRVLGRAVPETTPQMDRVEPSQDDALASQVASIPVAGTYDRNRSQGLATGQAWQAQFTFSSSRQRPPTGSGIVLEEDPATRCQPYLANALNYQTCLVEAGLLGAGVDPITGITAGAPFIRTPPRETLQSQMSFHVTPKWSATWGTTYDFRGKEFASQQVSLQRELHDWRAIFAFTQAPNGNFAFNFSISLNAEPDLRFPYDKATYRAPSR